VADEPLIAGIDAGTSHIRALVVTPQGRVVAEASRPTPTEVPRPGWAEHRPEALWQATVGALRQAINAVDRPQRIVGLAVASVGEAFIALDRDQRPVGRVIAWYDERTAPQVERVTEILGAERLYALTGLPPDPIFTLGKLMWLADNEPDVLARTASWLHVAHYLAWRLCGVPGGDLSLASRTMALDLRGLCWAEDLIREMGLDPSTFPCLRPSGSRLGRVTAEAAAATGLPESCMVGVGGHDHIVGALAADALLPGTLFNSLGTAEALTVTLVGPRPDPEFGHHGYQQGVIQVHEPRHYAFGGLPTSGGSIEWFRGLFEGALSHAQLIEEASAVGPGCEGVGFLPHLRGRFSPAPDSAARGAFYCLAADTSRGALFRAILEGIAFEARETVDDLASLPGVPPVKRIVAIGGNIRNELLMRIKASVHRQPILAAQVADTTALGAALLGGLAAGLFPDLPSAVAGLETPYREIAPVPDWVDIYEQRYQTVHRPAQPRLHPLHQFARAGLTDR
jgi:xylulokinase